MKSSLVNYLRCIRCAQSIRLLPEHTFDKDGQEVVSGNLECSGCNRQYPITRGVPRMVDAEMSTAQDVQTGETFGHAWRAFPRIDERYKQQLLDWIYPVDLEFLKDKLILDCGCGKGRHTNVLAQSEAKMIFGVDIGDAIDVAYDNVGHFSNVHIIQADVANMPFAAEMDYAFSLGVIDHMEQPAAGVDSMARRLNENGSMSIWVYGLENNWWIIGLINPFRIAVTSKLPSVIQKMVSGMMALPVFLWSKGVARSWHGLKKAVPSCPDLFYQDYMYYISRFDFTEIHHITHDHLVAPLANYSSKQEVQSWFDKAGLTNCLLRWHNKNSWSGFASKNQATVEKMRAKS